jgi:hypothetical protein
LIVTVRIFLSSVGHMVEARASYNPICRTASDRPDNTVLPEPFNKLRIPAHRNDMQLFAIESPNVTVSGFAEPGCPFENRVEDPREVARRA